MTIKVGGFVWLDWVVEKIQNKHNVEPTEVEEVFFNPPYKVRRAEGGKHLLYGRSSSGRYLFVVFTWEGRSAKIISARDMTESEKRFYGRK